MGVSSCVVESQSIFVPCLVELLTDCGLDIVSVDPSVDLDSLAAKDPGVVFIDLDFVQEPALESLRSSRRLLPDAIIVAYAQRRDASWFARCIAAGATLVVDKAAPERDIRERLRATVAMHSASALVERAPQKKLAAE